MLASAPLAVAAAFGPHWGFGFFPFFFLIPLFWIALIVVLAIVFTRNRRWALRNGYGAGPWAGRGGWNGPQGGSRGAEATLAERFAQGDIEEAEYRARLEVLRANTAHPPQA